MKDDKETRFVTCTAANCLYARAFGCRIRGIPFESRAIVDNSHHHCRLDRACFRAVVGGDAGGDCGEVAKSMPAILILITVGILIGTWMISGTIPMMIYYGIRFINPDYLIITAFLVTAVVSTFTGTSWGSVGTIGVAVIGIAMVQGVSLPVTAGAIVAGGYFGDRSPHFLIRRISLLLPQGAICMIISVICCTRPSRLHWWEW